MQFLPKNRESENVPRSAYSISVWQRLVIYLPRQTPRFDTRNLTICRTDNTMFYLFFLGHLAEIARIYCALVLSIFHWERRQCRSLGSFHFPLSVVERSGRTKGPRAYLSPFTVITRERSSKFFSCYPFINFARHGMPAFLVVLGWNAAAALWCSF